ncbi:hypothetical protein [Ruegeria arenilitoris]|uniref:hypothetical protein n=1 Tax=Ruegeria arenilitoris TaxID=1173585 RepID=UPI0020C25D45|nr:hypothetical protein [Ruegeria arenilitoris]
MQPDWLEIFTPLQLDHYFVADIHEQAADILQVHGFPGLLVFEVGEPRHVRTGEVGHQIHIHRQFQIGMLGKTIPQCMFQELGQGQPVVVRWSIGPHNARPMLFCLCFVRRYDTTAILIGQHLIADHGQAIRILKSLSLVLGIKADHEVTHVLRILLVWGIKLVRSKSEFGLHGTPSSDQNAGTCHTAITAKVVIVNPLHPYDTNTIFLIPDCTAVGEFAPIPA